MSRCAPPHCRQYRRRRQICVEGDEPICLQGRVRRGPGLQVLSDGRRQIEAFRVAGEVFGFEWVKKGSSRRSGQRLHRDLLSPPQRGVSGAER